jgi:hypothetical protein
VQLRAISGTDAFNSHRLYQHPVNAAGEGRHRLSKDKITQLAQTWEQRGWLTAPADATSPRYVTPTLSRLLDESWWEAEAGAV